MGYGNPCCPTCIHKDEPCYCSKNSACTSYDEVKDKIIEKVCSVTIDVELDDGPLKKIFFTDVNDAKIEMTYETEKTVSRKGIVEHIKKKVSSTKVNVSFEINKDGFKIV